MDSSVDTEHDLSVTSFYDGLQHLSTPNVTPRKAPAKRGKKFAKPAKPAEPVIGTCALCGKQYRSPKYFQRHKLDHNLKDVASKFPNLQQLNEGRSQIVVSVLQKMMESTPIETDGEDCRKVVLAMKEDLDKYEEFIGTVFGKFTSKLVSVKFCLPSSLLQLVQRVVIENLADVDFRKWTLQCLLSVDNSVSNVALHTFVLEFLFVLGNKLIHFITQSLMATSQPNVPPAEVFISRNERQAMHYVSGSIIRGYLRKARRYKNNKFWINIEVAIQKCILEGDRVVGASESDKYWTEFCNRGAFNFVGANFMDFIIEVTYLLLSVERPDGSLDDDVQRELLLSPARTLWDRMIGNNLDENDSILFMRGVVRSFTASYGRGSCLMRMNEEMENPEVTLSLRKRLAK